jgi:hypothetical protein
MSSNPTQFEECLNSFAEVLKQSYLVDENGEPTEIPEDQLAEIETTVTVTKERVEEAFKPLFESIQKQINENQARIEKFQQAITQQQAGHSGAASAAFHEMEGTEGMPSVDWLIANRKSKSDKKMTGYNAFTIWYMAQNKKGFPPKGVWETQNKAAWNALASQVGGTVQSEAADQSVNEAQDDEEAVEVPLVKGKGQRRSGYNMYTIDWMAKNPGKGFPPKGSWALVPEEEKKKYNNQAKLASKA